jgi:hypothetical protein
MDLAQGITGTSRKRSSLGLKADEAQAQIASAAIPVVDLAALCRGRSVRAFRFFT